MKRILLIEPHPDDICLSLAQHVRAMSLAGHKLMLATGCDPAPGLRTSQDYCEFEGIEHMGKIGPDLIAKQCRMPLPEFRKLKGNKYEEMMGDIAVRYPARISDEYDWILAVYKAARAEIVLCPVGLYHPMHIATTAAVMAVANKVTHDKPEKMLWFYLDFPYYFRQYGKKLFEDFQKLYKLKKVEFDLPITVTDKLKIFRKFYPTERSILMWDEPHYHTHAETIFQLV